MRQREKFEKGKEIEDHILSLFPKAVKTGQTEYYDLKLDGSIFVEVKSAELRVSMGRKKCTKWGRFIVNKENHEKLKEQAGWYALVLTFERLPVVTRFILAEKTRVICWKIATIIPMTELYNGITVEEFKEEIKCNQKMSKD